MTNGDQKNPEVLFEVFGDESSNGEIVAYGVIIVPTVRMSHIEDEVARAKREAGSLSTSRIHCKDLLHGDRRARTEWKDLSTDVSFLLLARVAEYAWIAGARAWVGFLDSRTAPERMYFEDSDTGSVVEERMNDVNLIHFAYLAAMAPVLKMIPHGQTRGWMDPNRNYLKWTNRNRQLRFAQVFFPVNHNNLRFEPMPVEGSKPMLLDLADIVVHCAARALSTQRPTGKERYEAVLHKMRPGLSVAQFNVPSGPIMSVQAKPEAVAEVRQYLHSYLSR